MSDNPLSVAGCGGCVCRNCLLWWSSRCPYGECYDDHRAKVNPYDAAHPTEPPWKLWTEWNKPGEQAHWCRGGSFYPTSQCPNFVQYQKPQIKYCLKAVTQVWADGYIQCSLIDNYGCAACYDEFLSTHGE